MELTILLYVNRANTNEEVYRGANEELGEAGTPIIPLGRGLWLKCMKLVGCIRKPRNHPGPRLHLLRERQSHWQLKKRNVGRPRLWLCWTHETMKIAWNIRTQPTMRNEDLIRWRKTFDLFVAVPVPPHLLFFKSQRPFGILRLGRKYIGMFFMDQLLFPLMCNLWTLVSFRSWLVTLASSRSSWARSAFCVVNFWLWNLLHCCDCKIS